MDFLSVQGAWLALCAAALAAYVVFLVRRAGQVRGAMGPVQLLARLPLEPRRSIYVIRVVDRVLVVGASEGGICELGQLPAESLESFPAAVRGGEGGGLADALRVAVAARGRPRGESERA